ncbi:fatty acid desaturase [Formosa sp. Hel1_33_131]|jgi:linoleoyl-CoA desaturase|uniref:fatty acid desaturase family protein n=1 Tax=Formosa sp. Hel1_33_131 TaxID=1336794 RepID=UPI00084E284B|nr:acyl-CoA desaturase [Formosa sp. Hel1_33_131]AOR27680.1 fatty acid desaturase [Formosa sp. Hel1_33_131]
MTKSTITFSRTDSAKFFKTLNSRVNNYFKENKINRSGNWKLWIKTIVMFSIFLVPYFLILTIDMPGWLQILFTVVMGVGMAGVGMNVMHDGNHGSFSNKSWINNIMGGSIYILAGNVYNWKVQHNVLHHTYTNIPGHDEDLDAGRVLRFTKSTEWKRHHKFQHIYSVLLYGLLTINWAITTDFLQMKRYMKRKLSYGKFPNPFLNWSTLVVSKVIYLSLWIVLPMLILDMAWYKVLLGFFVMHYTAGLILSMVFQLAHIMDEAEMPMPETNGTMKNTWAIHQLKTTVNFSPKNKLVNWFTGGLNHQVEHHIFPNISHVHYGKIAEIVKKTAKEFNLPYNEFETTRKAIIAHFKYLKEMGVKPVLQA